MGAEGPSEDGRGGRADSAEHGGRERVMSMSPGGSRKARHRDPADGGWRTRKQPGRDPDGAPGLADFAEQVNRLSDDAVRARAQSASPVGYLTGASSPSSNPFAEKDKTEPVEEPPQAVLKEYLTVSDDVRLYNSSNVAKRPDTVAVRRFRLTLVGAGEAGKTSLRKCFASNPIFFKNLPEVGTTTGIDVQKHRAKVSDDSVIDIEVNDFAGQEVYHSHSLFLTNRTLFVFVWNMSNVEQTDDDYGISPSEEVRLKQWADVVQAKCPGAPIIIVGTHKDQLRDSSRRVVERILNKVCSLISDYMDSFETPKDVSVITVYGSFCVSCRDRSVISENTGGPTKIKELFQWIAELCNKNAKTGLLFPKGCVPRYVVSLIATLEKMKADMETVLLPMKAYNALCKQLGIPKELLHRITTMLHDWGVLYLFDKSATKMGRQDCVFLHPHWLSVMVASVFTYAHTCTAPPHERATMEIRDLDIDACDAAEPSKLILEGVLTSSLAKVLFSKVLKQLKRDASEQNIEICFTMLRHLDLVYKNTFLPEEGPFPVPRGMPPAGDQYYVPSIYPRVCPKDLPTHISRLMRVRGVHRRSLLTPLPKEFIHMLHTRVGHMLMRLQVSAPCSHKDPPHKKVSNNWRDAWWMAGGGGEGADLGIGPMRALAVADMSARRVDLWAVGGDASDPRMLTLGKMADTFCEALDDLSAKYRGIVLKHEAVEEGGADGPADELAGETFEMLTACLRPQEVEFLLAELGFVATAAQAARVAELQTAREGEEPSSPVGQMKLSLILDKLVRACMLKDSSIATM